MLLYNAGEQATASEWNRSFELRVAGEWARSLGRVVDSLETWDPQTCKLPFFCKVQVGLENG
jgi:hypothetical protein